MSQSRGLTIDGASTRDLFDKIFNFLSKENLGLLLGVFDNMGNMIGGLIVVFQGQTVRYYKGASDPERRDISVLHLAIYEAIQISKKLEYKYFDLWGYNHLVNDTSQIYFINKFKKGFSDDYLFYPKMLHLSLKPFGFYQQRVLLWSILKLKNLLHF